MRILHVVDTDQRRGGEIFASDLIKALNAEGVSQFVAILQRTIGAHVAYQAETAHLAARRLRGWIDPWALLRLRSVIGRWKPDIVQGHGGQSVKYTGLTAVGADVRLVQRWIGTPPPWMEGQPRKALYGMLLRPSWKVVAVADSVRRELCRVFGFLADRAVTIPNGVDGRRLEPAHDPLATRRELGIPPEAPVVLSLTALAREKDPVGHVNVAARVLRARPDVVYVLAGDGPLRGEVEERIRQNGLGGRVRLTRAWEEVGDLLSVSDVLLSAGRAEGMEGMPGVAIEAGMAGLPVVGYAVAGLPEVVVDRRTGLLAPPGDADGLAARLLHLLQDQEGRRLMGNEARQICARFDIGAVAPRYLDLYREAVGRPR